MQYKMENIEAAEAAKKAMLGTGCVGDGSGCVWGWEWLCVGMGVVV